MDKGGDPLDRLVEAVLSSPKYRSMSSDLVRDVGARELAKGRSYKEAVKATKTRLHQTVGAYSGAAQYDRWLAELRRAYDSVDREAVLRTSMEVLRSHASTRERLPILHDFYAATLGEVTPIRTVVDVACGLNPISLPWMSLPEGVEYHAYDVDQDMVEFLDDFLAVAGVRGGARMLDVTRELPGQSADVALVLKAIPCLERLDPSAGPRLLEGLDARHVLVSFPVRSLGGRGKGMLRTYEDHFAELTAGKGWTVRRFLFSTELAFLVTK